MLGWLASYPSHHCSSMMVFFPPLISQSLQPNSKEREIFRPPQESSTCDAAVDEAEAVVSDDSVLLRNEPALEEARACKFDPTFAASNGEAGGEKPWEMLDLKNRV